MSVSAQPENVSGGVDEFSRIKRRAARDRRDSAA